MSSSSIGGSDSLGPETYFAPAPRATLADVRSAAMRVTQNAVVDHLLKTYGGLLAVLNEQRQILAVNHQLLRMLGVDDSQQVLGLRPGDAIDCVHANDHAGGCGTSRFCATCGAAIAIVVCQQEGASAYRECVLDCSVGGEPTTLDLRVHASKLELDGERFILLYLQDVSTEKRRAAVERAFFHDTNNLLMALSGTLDLLRARPPAAQGDIVAQAHSILRRITAELEMQRVLSSTRPAAYRVEPTEFSVDAMLDELVEQSSVHPAARGKGVIARGITAELSLRSDLFLVTRVLTNMLLNALEATTRGGKVIIEAAAEDDEVVFSVWNAGAISEGVALRIFQRYFSTKPGVGRGVGTFAMKLFGESFLGGEVAFTTSESDGTRFFLRLPCDFFAAEE